MAEKLKSAPVYFTIAQVRHNPILKITQYAGEIQDRLRKEGYTEFEEQSFVIPRLPSSEDFSDHAGLPFEEVRRLMFFSADHLKGFIVQKNSVSFHTTEYESFEVLTEEFIKGLQIVNECVKLAFSQRIGLRYLNVIVPSGGEEGLNNYMIPGVLGLASNLPEEVEIFHTFSETSMRTRTSAVVARTIIQSAALGFPNDLQPIGLKLPERFQSISNLHAVIDIDASSTSESQAFDLEFIRLQLTNLHEGAEMAFNKTSTPYARDVWGN